VLRRLLILLVLAAPAAAQRSPPNEAAPQRIAAAASAGTPCVPAIAAAERAHAIPEGLLHAIGAVEAGVPMPDGHVLPWPWARNAAGEGKIHPDRASALADAAELLERRVLPLDIGCMQISIGIHGAAFPDLATAFDPAANADYAGRFLRGLATATDAAAPDWWRAVGHYHSQTPERAEAYRQIVARAYQRLVQDRPQWQAMVAAAERAAQRGRRPPLTTPPAERGPAYPSAARGPGYPGAVALPVRLAAGRAAMGASALGPPPRGLPNVIRPGSAPDAHAIRISTAALAAPAPVGSAAAPVAAGPLPPLLPPPAGEAASRRGPAGRAGARG
jgi:hypothetical protein